MKNESKAILPNHIMLISGQWQFPIRIIKTKLCGFLAFLILFTNAFAASKTATMELVKAVNREYNTAHCYGDFAKKAEAEGYIEVAKLFHAIAKAEHIHRQAIATAVSAMGIEAVEPLLESSVVKSTRDNLKTVITSETAEATFSYPKLEKLLQKEPGTEAAIRIIGFAKAAESHHINLFKEALANLGKNKATEYFVCPVCSFLSQGKAQKPCSGCKVEQDPINVP